ncbi:hypothetical protein [Sphingobium sp. DC-2]|uniref:hypothetical protein n=1 Tax=Sphingobium sp. DC-2 TaxID=1303256 RepID=UPI0004C30FFA|nr:hypothetical protein [Sphingobium sp. DC-2]
MHYLNGFTPENECPDCDGYGVLSLAHSDCEACEGTGWRAMTDDELADAAERQAEDAASEPPVTLAEQHRAAWLQKEALS